jgi:hypothetical protein
MKKRKLSEAPKVSDDNVFGNVAFGDPNHKGGKKGAVAFTKLQNKPNEFEKNTEVENEIWDALYSWTGLSSEVIAKKLYKHEDLFRRAQSKFPSVFKPTTKNGTKLYRGISNVNKKVLSKIRKTTMDDYKSLEIGGDTFYKYNTPIKYTPRSPVQSWSTSINISKEFWELGLDKRYSDEDYGAILISIQNDEYLMSQAALHIIYNTATSKADEKETLHFGKNYGEDVFICFSEYDLKDILGMEYDMF